MITHGLLGVLQNVERLHDNQAQILDDENRAWVVDLYKKLNGYETINLSSIDADRIQLLVEETFFK